ncbi:MAG: ATP-binding protein, partial [Paracoccaceae bacterium]|nr:ATP-binding protein [Paracoccaceae bacterium]
MPNAITLDEPLGRLSEELSAHSGKILLAALGLAVSGFLVAPPPLDLPAIAAGAALASLAVIGLGVTGLRRRRQRASLRDIALLTAADPSPCLMADADGEVGFLNEAARKRFGSAEGGTLVHALGDLFANPSGVLFRLQEKATALGGAHEDVITRRGLVRLTVTDAGERRYFWRFEEIADARTPVRGGDALGLPMLIATKSGAILFMNEVMRQVVGGRAKHLDRVVKDLPLRPGEVHELTTPDGPRRYRLVEIGASGGRSELYFLPADAGAAVGSSAVESASAAGIEDLPVGLLELRADGVIVAANRLARELLRPEGEGELAGVALADRLEGLGRPVRDWLDEASKGRGLGRPEVLRVRSQEAEAYLQVTLGRVAGRRGVRLVAVLNDATELKTLEAQFVQSQKMQAIGQLAGGVAHDFNNLLTAISGHCDLMLLRHDQSDPDYGDLVQIHQNANRAAGLVGQLLAFSRKQTLQPQVIDLRDTLADLTHLLNRLVGERVALTLNHEPGLPPIRADRRQLEQVLMNLVVNARDAMPDGGEIRIGTATRVLGDELRRDRATVPPGRYVVVKVEDRGIGIPPDKLTKIFEPFYTSKRVGEGTGLGLSTAYGIVKQSGGFIFVDSVVGSGSVFT